MGGVAVGATDGNMGFNIIKDEVHVPDLKPPSACLCGIDHERLTFRSAGLDFKLTVRRARW